MTDEYDALLQIANSKSKVTALTGTFVSATASAFTVDVGGGRIPAQSLTNYLPDINENVWVIFIDGKPFVTGPTATIADRGTVVSSASGLVSLTTDYGPVVCPYVGSTPTPGDVWKLVKSGGYTAFGPMSTQPTPNLAPAAPGGGVARAHTDYFNAITAGSYGFGRWGQAQVYGSDSYQGAWFYGSKISDTIPAGASIGTVSIFVSTKGTGTQITGSAPNFALHAYMAQPGGAPSFGSQAAENIGGGGWVGLPSSWGNSLKHGGGSYGVGLNHGGYNILSSLAQDGFSGRLRITSVY